MSRTKTEIVKIKEGYGTGTGKNYSAFLRANETHRLGTSTQLLDPIANRTVDLLSIGEYDFFWQLRFDEEVVEIQEQYPLYNKNLILDICLENGLNPARHTQRIMTTDFLVTYKDGRKVAYSCKKTRKEYGFAKEEVNMSDAQKKLIIRQYIEYCYWVKQGIEFRTVITSELNRTYSENIAHVMNFYSPRNVINGETFYKYLIAHHEISVNMKDCFLRIPSDIWRYDEAYKKITARRG